MDTHFQNLDISGLVEAVQSLLPWSDQKFCHLRLKSYILKILVGPIIVWLRLFSNGRTSLALRRPCISKIWSLQKLRKIQIFFAKLKFETLENLDCAKCFASSRLPKSGVCEIFCKVQIFSAKPQSKCISRVSRIRNRCVGFTPLF